jgi:hypothetical protein
VMDLLTRFPEITVVAGTSVDDNIHALDSVFSRHGQPKVFLTDGGPPWNTSYDNPLQVYFRSMGIEHRTTRSADDPEANGVCEAFMKHLKKIWHTSLAQYKDPEMEINTHLRAFRTTPHPTTGAAPGELLYARTIRNKLPDMRTNPALTDPHIKQAREEDKRQKELMKKYKDSKRSVVAHNIQVGDNVLRRQRETKQDPPFDPHQYVVTEVHGTQIEARRGDEVVRRDAQKWKKVQCRAPRRFGFSRTDTHAKEEDADIGPKRSKPAQRAAPREDQPGIQEEERAPEQHANRADIRARLARNPAVIIAGTVANRPIRTRRPPQLYQAEPLKTQKAGKRTRPRK